jgi:predicted RNase H-like nuclease (RuvC/YqgF family)
MKKSKSINKVLSKGFPKPITKIINTKVFLYVVALFSLISVFSFIISGNTSAIVVFILLGLITRSFSNNMGIVLLVPLVIVNLFLGTKLVKEGLEAMEKSKDENEDEEKDEKKESEVSEGFYGKNNKTRESLENKNKNEKDEAMVNKEPRMDLASTLSDAYKKLNDNIGKDGISKLTDDTKNLMNQQKQLAETMENIQPMLSNMQPIIDQATNMMKSLGGGFGGGNKKE